MTGIGRAIGRMTGAQWSWYWAAVPEYSAASDDEGFVIAATTSKRLRQ